MATRTLVVVQSRLSSSRLPGKAMLSLAGMPMVVLAALRAGNAGAEVVVATSDRSDDDVIASAAGAAGLAVVRGPLEDPLTRFVTAAGTLDDDDVVVRLTADNVVPDGELVELLAAPVRSGRHQYVRVGGDDRSLPYGLAGEAFTARVLREADRAPGANREHVTPWIRETVGDLTVEVADPDPAWGGQRCTVDTFDDFVRMSRLFAEVPDPRAVPWRELCSRLVRQEGAAPEEWPAASENVLHQGPVVLGTVQLGLAYGASNKEGRPSDEVAAEILRTAARVGISHLDTARAYGDSEDRIGAARARGLSESVGVVTKVLPLDAVPHDADAHWCRSAVMASVTESLRRLRTDRVDAVLLHRAEDWSKGRGAVRDTLVELREQGVCRLVGVSVGHPAELLEVLADPACGYVQLPFNVLDTRWLSADVADAFARRPDVVVTVRSVFLQGLLVSGDDVAWPTNCGVDPSEVRTRLLGLVDELARDSLADLCIAYALGQPWVTSVVLGAETPAQLRESAALGRRPVLTADQRARVREALPAVGEQLLDPSRWTW